MSIYYHPSYNTNGAWFGFVEMETDLEIKPINGLAIYSNIDEAKRLERKRIKQVIGEMRKEIMKMESIISNLEESRRIIKTLTKNELVLTNKTEVLE